MTAPERPLTRRLVEKEESAPLSHKLKMLNGNGAASATVAKGYKI